MEDNYEDIYCTAEGLLLRNKIVYPLVIFTEEKLRPATDTET